MSSNFRLLNPCTLAHLELMNNGFLLHQGFKGEDSEYTAKIENLKLHSLVRLSFCISPFPYFSHMCRHSHVCTDSCAYMCSYDKQKTICLSWFSRPHGSQRWSSGPQVWCLYLLSQLLVTNFLLLMLKISINRQYAEPDMEK